MHHIIWSSNEQINMVGKDSKYAVWLNFFGRTFILLIHTKKKWIPMWKALITNLFNSEQRKKREGVGGGEKEKKWVDNPLPFTSIYQVILINTWMWPQHFGTFCGICWYPEANFMQHCQCHYPWHLLPAFKIHQLLFNYKPENCLHLLEIIAKILAFSVLIQFQRN